MIGKLSVQNFVLENELFPVENGERLCVKTVCNTGWAPDFTEIITAKQVCFWYKSSIKVLHHPYPHGVENGLRDSMEHFSVCTCHGMNNSQDVFVH